MNTIDLYFITGFLGAGKTTFLNEFLDKLSGKKTAVIMNEFGSISIDGPRLDNYESLIEINNGVIFCSCLKGNFISQLIKLSHTAIDTVIIEASGIGDPGNIASILDDLVDRCGAIYQYRGLINIVDCASFIEIEQVLPAVAKQIKRSNYLIINKTSLVSTQRLKQVENKVLELNPDVDIIQTNYCKIDDIFYNHLLKPSQLDELLSRSCAESDYSCETINTPESRPYSVTLKTQKLFTLERLTEFLNHVKDGFYRIKGDAVTEEGIYQVDVAGSIVTTQKTDRTTDATELVFISVLNKSVKEELLEKDLFYNWTKYLVPKL